MSTGATLNAIAAGQMEAVQAFSKEMFTKLFDQFEKSTGYSFQEWHRKMDLLKELCKDTRAGEILEMSHTPETALRYDEELNSELKKLGIVWREL